MNFKYYILTFILLPVTAFPLSYPYPLYDVHFEDRGVIYFDNLTLIETLDTITDISKEQRGKHAFYFDISAVPEDRFERKVSFRTYSFRLEDLVEVVSYEFGLSYSYDWHEQRIVFEQFSEEEIGLELSVDEHYSFYLLENRGDLELLFDDVGRMSGYHGFEFYEKLVTGYWQKRRLFLHEASLPKPVVLAPGSKTRGMRVKEFDVVACFLPSSFSERYITEANSQQIDDGNAEKPPGVERPQ